MKQKIYKIPKEYKEEIKILQDIIADTYQYYQDALYELDSFLNKICDTDEISHYRYYLDLDNFEVKSRVP